MEPLCATERFGDDKRTPLPHTTTPHPTMGQTLCHQGLYETRDQVPLTSPSLTCTESPTSPTIVDTGMHLGQMCLDTVTHKTGAMFYGILLF